MEPPLIYIPTFTCSRGLRADTNLHRYLLQHAAAGRCGAGRRRQRGAGGAASWHPRRPPGVDPRDVLIAACLTADVWSPCSYLGARYTEIDISFSLAKLCVTNFNTSYPGLLDSTAVFTHRASTKTPAMADHIQLQQSRCNYSHNGMNPLRLKRAVMASRSIYLLLITLINNHLSSRLQKELAL